MTRIERILSAIGLIVFALILFVVLRAYVSPAMLVDFANLRLCS